MTRRSSFLIVTALVLAAPAPAQEEDPGVVAVPDSVFAAQDQPGPSYQTVFDSDRSRTNWLQTLSWFRNTPRLAFSTNASLTTQEFTAGANRGTFGNVFGRLDARITPRWLVSLDGKFDMNSSTDGSRDTDSRRNQVQIRTQYTLSPIPTMNLTGGLYSEFQQYHDRAVQQYLVRADEFDPATVDTLRAQRDSSYTTARKDGLSATAGWHVKPWLELRGTAAASRRKPTQRSLVRDFANAADGTGGSTTESRLHTSEPSDNSSFTSQLTFTRIPRTRIAMGVQHSSLDQSQFSKQFRGLEQMSYDRDLANARLEYGPFHKAYLTVDGSLTRTLQSFLLRTTSNSLVTARQLTSTLVYNDVDSRASVAMILSRNRNERQVSQNGVVLNRNLGANGMRKISRRLTVDGAANFSLQSLQYLDPRGDQDMARSLLSVGGGYAVSPRCSTTVRFSRQRSHIVFVDPAASATNSVQSNYQMFATLRLDLSRDVAIRQDYLLSAEYKIFDHESSESQNFLNRVRRIDTSIVDSLFGFAFVKMTHNFLFRDQGAYRRESAGSERTYRVSVETYEQTLAAMVGIDILDGVRFVATQSLLHQRNYFLAIQGGSRRNRFALNAGLEVQRSLPGGAQLQGAVRHVGGYDERVTPVTRPNEEDYWIAGVTLQKEF